MAGLRPLVFGKRIVVNLHRKKGYSISPGTNARARAMAKCLRGKSKSEADKCWDSVGEVKGK